MNRIEIRRSVVLLISVLLLAFGQVAEAQKSKREEVYKNKLFKDYLDVYYYYDNDNKVTSTQFVLYGQDLRFQQLVELATIYRGSPKSLMAFMNEVEKFFNENDPEFSTVIEGRTVQVVKQSGIKGFYIFEKGEDGSGFRGYNMKTWGKIKDALVDWAKKNGESLD